MILEAEGKAADENLLEAAGVWKYLSYLDDSKNLWNAYTSLHFPYTTTSTQTHL